MLSKDQLPIYFYASQLQVYSTKFCLHIHRVFCMLVYLRVRVSYHALSALADSAFFLVYFFFTHHIFVASFTIKFYRITSAEFQGVRRPDCNCATIEHLANCSKARNLIAPILFLTGFIFDFFV